MNELSIKSFQGRDVKALLSKTETKAYVFAILTFFTLAFFTVFAIRPALISFFSVRKQIEDAQIVDKKLEEKINDLLQAQEVYTTNQNGLTLIDQALPSEPNFSEFLHTYEIVVNDNEATISAFKTNEEIALFGKDQQQVLSPLQAQAVDSSQEPLSPRIRFNSTIAGQYPNMINTLLSFLNLRRMVTVDRIEFKSNSATNESKDDTITNTLEANVHYSP